MDIAAALENTKTFIRPVGAIASFQYFSPRQQQNQRQPEQKKEADFHMIFQMELQAPPKALDKDQSFQMYV